ncbi:MAG TPA: 50S ribosomal protein L13 [Candidatus Dormibacteraeota bacterium]|nr:50S ribosomal protein L13 [Candidatus Dormibacteraeota bacterium]
MKTYSAKPSDVQRKWYVIDASEDSLGRLATKVATLLTGKGKPQFTHHIDCGDYVIVTNAKNMKVTGDKLKQKFYYRHSGYPGGLKTISLAEQMNNDPSKVIVHAIRGMLPVNKLRDGRLERLKVYAEADHNHEAQKPITLSLRNHN